MNRVRGGWGRDRGGVVGVRRPDRHAAIHQTAPRDAKAEKTEETAALFSRLLPAHLAEKVVKEAKARKAAEQDGEHKA